MERRDFVLRGTAATAALSTGPLALLASACQPPRIQSATRPAAAWGGTVRQAGEGEGLVSGRRRGLMHIKVDTAHAPGVTMSMVVSEVPPGGAIPVHLHQREDEIIFLHSGQGLVTLGEERVPSTAGAMLYAPRGVWHGIQNTGTEVITWCAIWSPAGFEQYFKEVGTPPGEGQRAPSAEELAAAARKYGMVFRDT
jgi:mannose-6-phosphate isomerase-like protein (cupin superfamily)